MIWRVNYSVKTRAEVMGHHLLVEAKSHKEATEKARLTLEKARYTGRVPDNMGLFRVGEYDNYTIGKVRSVKEQDSEKVHVG